MTESEGDARISLAVVGEDHLHALLAKNLTDHVWLTLVHNHDAPWLETLDQHRRWYVLPHLGGAGYLDSHKTGAELWPPEIKPRLQRRLGGVPLAAGAHRLLEWRALFALQSPPPEMVVVLLDTDGRDDLAPEVMRVLTWAAGEPGPRLVVGLPAPEAEAWLVAGWRPTTSAETQRSADAQKLLSFDATQHPEKLTSHPNTALQDAKRVVQFVILGEGDTLVACSSRAPRPQEAVVAVGALLARLGPQPAYQRCGLAHFIEQLDTQLTQVLRSHWP